MVVNEVEVIVDVVGFKFCCMMEIVVIGEIVYFDSWMGDDVF